jgi:predicted membrane-bound spermidine synthase
MPSVRFGKGPVLAFFLSGAASLIFELVWFDRCGLLMGNTVWATSIVLSSFMGGLALGNALVAWYGSRLRSDLLVYGWLEVLVAASGVGLTFLLGALLGWIAPFTNAFLDARWLVNIVRFTVAFPLLLLPTTAMGATLPVLVGAMCRSDDRFGTVLGRLYGWNTLGAVVGVLGAELLLIERVGVAGSAFVAAALNLAAAAIALLMYRNAVQEPRAARAIERVKSTVNRSDRPFAWLICAVLMGGTLMALEVVWFRFLSMFVVASTLAVSLMLAVVLAAIGIGGLIGSFWLKRRPEAQADLPPVVFAAGVALVGSYGAFRFLTGDAWTADWYRMLWSTTVLTFGTTMLSGVAFVMLGSAIRGSIATVEAAGRLALANTIGGMLGPLIAAFVLLPRTGIERSLFALTLAYVAAGIVAVWASSKATSSRSRRVTWTAAIAVGLALVMFPFGSMAATYVPRAIAVYSEDGSRLVATREGTSETIHLMAKTWLGKALYYRLVTNGFSMSGTHTSGKRYMRYFAYWPMLLHKGPLRRALIVCYGAGVTAAALTSIKSLESIDVAEISPDIVAMSDVIYSAGERPLEDRRVRLHIEDGRYFLQATGQRFDVITGEPPPPLTPGTVNLYSREYFQLMRDRLEEGGIVTYWLPVAKRGEYDVKAIIASFCSVFDDCSLWNGTVFDWMLVGTRHLEGRVPERSFSAAWDDPLVWPKLREIGFEVPQEIGATFLGDASDLSRLAGGTPPVTDNYPQRLRPAATRLSLTQGPTDVDREIAELVTKVTDPSHARQAFQRSEFVQKLWPEHLADATLPFFDIQTSINTVIVEGARPLARIEDLHRLLTTTTLRRVPLWMLGSDDAQQEAAEVGKDASGMVEYVIGIRALVARDYFAAAGSFAEAERRHLRIPTVRPLMAYALCMAGRLDLARQLVDGAQPEGTDERHFWTWLSATFQLRPHAGN